MNSIDWFLSWPLLMLLAVFAPALGRVRAPRARSSTRSSRRSAQG